MNMKKLSLIALVLLAACGAPEQAGDAPEEKKDR